MKSCDTPPRPTRINVSLDAVLVTSDNHEVPVIVKDLSREGFRIELDDQVLVGERVKLRVRRDDEITAEIKWALGREAGGVFLDGQGELDS
jgi:hypothetical protein